MGSRGGSEYVLGEKRAARVQFHNGLKYIKMESTQGRKNKTRLDACVYEYQKTSEKPSSSTISLKLFFYSTIKIHVYKNLQTNGYLKKN